MTMRPVTAETLKLKTWVLKVSIDCQGCKKKVQKVLKDVQGVYGTVIDAQHNKVTVTGEVDADTLIKRLAKSGKHAELIAAEKLPEKKKDKSVKLTKNEKQSNPKGKGGERKADMEVEDQEDGGEEILEVEETKEGGGKQRKKQRKKKEKQSGQGAEEMMVVGSPVSTLQPFDPTAYQGYPMSTLPPLDPTAYHAQPVNYGMDPIRSSADEYEDQRSGCFVM